MLYNDYLKKMKVCPFCLSEDRHLASNKNAFLTYSKAPYHKHHLLVIPKRHIESFFDISVNEKNDIDKLIKIGAMVLRKLKYINFTILVRDGDASNKSVKHVHYHVIPADPIGDLNHAGEPRVVMSKKEITKISEEISSVLSNL